MGCQLGILGAVVVVGEDEGEDEDEGH